MLLRCWSARARRVLSRRAFSAEVDVDRDAPGAPPSALRGMPDYFHTDATKMRYLEHVMRHQAELHGFAEVRTPILEKLEVFRRSLGETSDVVAKEMFAFPDKFQRTVCLRPEGTAGVMRAIIQHDMLKPSGPAPASAVSSSPSNPKSDSASCQRLFYSGPMFRYENPQRGRLRQFNQFGIELIGSRAAESGGWECDVEVIALGAQILKHLQLFPQYTALKINTLGDTESRVAYKAALTAFFEPRKSQLSSNSQLRLERGAVMRILDSKEAADKQLLVDAPKLSDSLTTAARYRFDRVRRELEQLDIPFEWDEQLVRGLDYYSQTCWEFIEAVPASTAAAKKLGQSQSAVLAGGRYDGLAETMGAKATAPSIGWAAGLERIKLLRESLGLPFATADQSPLLAIVVHRTKTVSQALAAVSSMPSSDAALNDDAHLVVAAQRLSRQLRDCGLRVLLGSATMLNSAATKKQLELAVKLNATGVVFLGDDSSSAEAATVNVSGSTAQTGTTSSELYAALRTATTPESKQQAAQALVAHLVGSNASIAPQLQTFSYKDLRTRAQSDKQAWTQLPSLLQPAL